MLGLTMPNYMMSLTQTVQGKRLLAVVMAIGRKQSLQALALEIERFRRNTGQYPISLEVLAATAGFEQDRDLITTPGISYALTTVSDSVWNFNRAMVAGVDLTHTTSTAYLATNSCGTGNFSSASDWCGSKQLSDWYKTESRRYFMSETTAARSRLNQTLLKFAASWNANGSFPAGSLSAGGAKKLNELVTAVGTSTSVTASTCTGVFTLANIPLDCGDLFTSWGSPIMYNYISSSYIALVAETPFTFSSGAGPQYLAVEMNYTY